MTGVSFSGFDMLVVDHENVTGSWRKWFWQFDLEIDMKVMQCGTELISGVQTAKFNNRAKLLALVKHVGEEGMNVLRSSGFDVKAPASTYEAALELLKGHFERDESDFVKTQKFVTVRQGISENNRDYLLRVDQLSRNLDLATSENAQINAAQEVIRRKFALVLAVNGLVDVNARKELMQKADLNWDNMSELLKIRHRVQEDEVQIGSRASSPFVKREVVDHGYDVSEVKGRDRTFEPEWKRSAFKSSRERSPSPYKGNRVSFRKSGSPGRQGRSSFQGSRDRSQSPSSRNLLIECFNCMGNHFARNCPKIQCHRCAKFGHVVKDCKERQSARGRSPIRGRSPLSNVRTVGSETQSILGGKDH